MKRLFLITCCLFFGNTFFSQDYIPFPDSVATWSANIFEYVIIDGLSTSYSDRGVNYHLEGDTLINDTLYSKLYTRFSWRSSSESGPNAYSFDTNYTQFDQPYILIGGVREDSEKKVWYKNIKFDNWGNTEAPFPWYYNKVFGTYFADEVLENSEVLLYDFGLEVGDSIYFRDANCESSSDWAVLEEVSVGLLDRRNFVFNSDFWYEPAVWVEGIGDISSDPFSRFDISMCEGLGFDFGKKLACFWQSEEQVYTDNSNNFVEDCEGLILVGIDELEMQSLEIYPNPSEGRFVIELPAYFDSAQHDLLLVVYNRLGQEILRGQDVLVDRFEIDLGVYPAGIYMVQLTAGGNGTGPRGIGASTSTGSGTYSAKVVKE